MTGTPARRSAAIAGHGQAVDIARSGEIKQVAGENEQVGALLDGVAADLAESAAQEAAPGFERRQAHARVIAAEMVVGGGDQPDHSSASRARAGRTGSSAWAASASRRTPAVARARSSASIRSMSAPPSAD